MTFDDSRERGLCRKLNVNSAYTMIYKAPCTVLLAFTSITCNVRYQNEKINVIVFKLDVRSHAVASRSLDRQKRSEE